MTGDWRITDEEFMAPGDNWDFADLSGGFDGYAGLDFDWHVQQVADRIFHIHLDRDIKENFVFSLTCNADGERDGGVVSLPLPSATFYLVESLESKRMTDDRDAVETDGILAIKNCLMDSYGRLRHYAVSKGLI